MVVCACFNCGRNSMPDVRRPLLVWMVDSDDRIWMFRRRDERNALMEAESFLDDHAGHTCKGRNHKKTGSRNKGHTESCKQYHRSIWPGHDYPCLIDCDQMV